MPSIIRAPDRDTGITDITQENIDRLSQQLSTIYSRDALAQRVVTVTAAYQILPEDGVVICSNSAGNYNVTLPPANSYGANKSGRIVIQRDGTGALITATVVITAGDTLVIDPALAGGAVLGIGTGVEAVCNGTNTWLIR